MAPTEKQKKAFDLILENIGTKGEAILEAGYTKSVSETPSLVTKSKGYIELMNQYGLDDDSLAKKHKQLLNCGKEEIEAKNLDMAYKLKGHYAPEKKQIGGVDGKDLFPLSNKESEEYAQWRIQQGLSAAVEPASAKETPVCLGSGQSDEDEQRGIV